MTSYLERSLDLPLRQVLAQMQRAILDGSRWCGVRTLKSPLDAWIYQEVLWELRPQWIVELGTASGGSALMLAHLCDLMGQGRVITVDRSLRNLDPRVREHPCIHAIEGEALAVAGRIRRTIPPGERVLVIEDSDHGYQHTLEVIKRYSALLQVGDYLICEDGICHHGLETGPNPGPFEAIEAFLEGNPRFAADRSRERFLITWNPKGYLRRVR